MSIKSKQRDGGGGEESSEQPLSRSKTVVKRPPSGSGSLTRTKTTVKKGSPAHSSGPARVRRSSLERVSQQVDVKPSKKPGGDGKGTPGKKSVSSNETYVREPLSSSLEDSQSQSDVSLSSSQQVAAGTADSAGLKSSSAVDIQREGGTESGSGSRPNSARKQWTNEQSQVRQMSKLHYQ